MYQIDYRHVGEFFESTSQTALEQRRPTPVQFRKITFSTLPCHSFKKFNQWKYLPGTHAALKTRMYKRIN
jgi:hypothetical protein